MPAARGLLLAKAAAHTRGTLAATARHGPDVDDAWQALHKAVEMLGDGEDAGAGGELGHPTMTRGRQEVLELMAAVDAGPEAAVSAETAGRDPLLFLAC